MGKARKNFSIWPKIFYRDQAGTGQKNWLEIILAPGIEKTLQAGKIIEVAWTNL